MTGLVFPRGVLNLNLVVSAHCIALETLAALYRYNVAQSPYNALTGCIGAFKWYLIHL